MDTTGLDWKFYGRAFNIQSNWMLQATRWPEQMLTAWSGIRCWMADCVEETPPSTVVGLNCLGEVIRSELGHIWSAARSLP